jgi:signal peptidase I
VPPETSTSSQQAVFLGAALRGGLPHRERDGIVLKHSLTLLTLGLCAAWFVVLGPAPIGGPATYVVIDGTSMEPTLVDGDLAVVRRSDAYRSGDIVAFRIPQSESDGLVIHRIVGGSAKKGYETQGDNRAGRDPWRPQPDDIAGSVWFTLPGVGKYLAVLKEPLVMASLASGVIVFLILLGGGSRSREAQNAGETSWLARLRRFMRFGRVQP